MESFHETLSASEQADPRFAYRVAFVPKLGSKASSSDLAIEFYSADSDETIEANKIFLKEIEKKRYTATQIIEIMKSEGFIKFGRQDHTELWRSLDAKNPNKKLGCPGDYTNTWVWFESWVNRVRLYCQDQDLKYKA